MSLMNLTPGCLDCAAAGKTQAASNKTKSDFMGVSLALLLPDFIQTKVL
jgi:hypothetical protein